MAAPGRKAIFGLAAALGITTCASISHIGPGQFGLRETFYQLVSGIIPPGIYGQVPFVQFTHNFEANTQRIEFNAGSCRFWPLCENTKDQNALTASVALNYRVLPDAEKLGFHLWAMDGFVMPDGYWLLTDLLNTSANAVMGKYNMAYILSNPEEFLDELRRDFTIRLQQNNIPVEVESLELKKFNTSIGAATQTVSYQSWRNPDVKSAAQPP